jgi:hypothetical protein
MGFGVEKVHMFQKTRPMMGTITSTMSFPNLETPLLIGMNP